MELEKICKSCNEICCKDCTENFNFMYGGEFSYLKRLLRNYNGCSKKLKLKMIDEYFENHKIQNKKRKNRA